jgi:hypothetical protein
VVFRGGRPLQGGSGEDVRSVVDLLFTATLCIECVIRKVNVSPARAEELLAQIACRFRVVDIGTCDWCLTGTITYGLARFD